MRASLFEGSAEGGPQHFVALLRFDITHIMRGCCVWPSAWLAAWLH